MTEITTINLFYPMLFIVIIILIVTIGIIIRGKNSDNKDTFIFAKSSDNAKEITLDVNDKFSKAHTEVVKIKWDKVHEEEIHRMEEMIKEINDKVDMLIQRVIELEKANI